MATTAITPFTFDEAAHVYRVDGVVIPSVTQILSELGYSNIEIAERFNAEAVEHKRQLGKLVHQAAHYWDENDLAIHNAQGHLMIHERVYGYLKGYLAFRAATGYEPATNEGRGVGEHLGMRYGMTFDSIGKFNGKLPWVIVDLKTASGSAQRSWGLQVTAYTMGQTFQPKVAHSQFLKILVQLFPDGKFKVFSSADKGSKIFTPNDPQIWAACLAISIDQRNHKIPSRAA